MKNVLMLLLGLVLSTLPAPAMAEPDVFPLISGEVTAFDQAIEAEIKRLPNDENKLYLTIFGQPGEARYEKIKSWFETDPQMKSLKNQMHFNYYGTDTVMYKDRYAKSTPVVPCIRVQGIDNSTGKVVTVYKVSGDSVPATSQSVLKDILTKIKAHCPDGRCRPQPPPAPPVLPDPPEQPLDDGGEPDVPVEPESGLLPWWAMAGLLAAGAGAGSFSKYKDMYYPPVK